MSVTINKLDEMQGVDYPIAGRARVLAAGLIVAGGALQLLEFLLEPAFDSSAERVAWWAEHSAQLGTSQALGLLAVPCMLGGFLYAYRLVRQDSRRLAGVAIAMLVSAMIGLGLIHGVELAASMAASAGHPDAAVAVLEAESPSASAIVGFVMFLPMAVFGSILIAVAMWRSRYVPRLVVLFLLGFTAVDFVVGNGVVSHASALVADVILAWAIITRYERTARTEDPAIAD